LGTISSRERFPPVGGALSDIFKQGNRKSARARVTKTINELNPTGMQRKKKKQIISLPVESTFGIDCYPIFHCCGVQYLLKEILLWWESLKDRVLLTGARSIY